MKLANVVESPYLEAQISWVGGCWNGTIHDQMAAALEKEADLLAVCRDLLNENDENDEGNKWLLLLIRHLSHASDLFLRLAVECEELDFEDEMA